MRGMRGEGLEIGKMSGRGRGVRRGESDEK